MENIDPKNKEMVDAVARILSGETRGFLIVGSRKENGEIDTKASIQNVSISDVAVAVCGIVAQAGDIAKKQAPTAPATPAA